MVSGLGARGAACAAPRGSWATDVGGDWRVCRCPLLTVPSFSAALPRAAVGLGAASDPGVVGLVTALPAPRGSVVVVVVGLNGSRDTVGPFGAFGAFGAAVAVSAGWAGAGAGASGGAVGGGARGPLGGERSIAAAFFNRLCAAEESRSWGRARLALQTRAAVGSGGDGGGHVSRARAHLGVATDRG